MQVSSWFNVDSACQDKQVQAVLEWQLETISIYFCRPGYREEPAQYVLMSRQLNRAS